MQNEEELGRPPMNWDELSWTKDELEQTHAEGQIDSGEVLVKSKPSNVFGFLIWHIYERNLGVLDECNLVGWLLHLNAPNLDLSEPPYYHAFLWGNPGGPKFSIWSVLFCGTYFIHKWTTVVIVVKCGTSPLWITMNYSPLWITMNKMNYDCHSWY